LPALYQRKQRQQSREAQIIDDFEKLMVIKSPMKLMIYESEDKDQNDLIMRRISEYLSRYSQHVEGETYCLLNYSHDRHEAYSFMVPANGKLTPDRVKFQFLKEASGSNQRAAA
jgi:hypothetical protein